LYIVEYDLSISSIAQKLIKKWTYMDPGVTLPEQKDTNGAGFDLLKKEIALMTTENLINHLLNHLDEGSLFRNTIRSWLGDLYHHPKPS
jgi:hypothetical protein